MADSISSAELLILGSGTSAGVPVIGCACEVCTSDDPRDNRLRTSACLTFTDGSGSERCILIDTSPDLRQQSLRHRLSRCDGILFTHSHVDHTFGLDEVRRFNALMNAPIDVYGDAETLGFVHRIYPHIFDRANNVNDSFVATLIAHRIEPGQAFNLHGLRIEPLHLLHGRQPVLGYRVEPSAVSHQPSARSGRRPEDEYHAGPESSMVRIESPETTQSIFPLAYCTDVSSIPPETWPRLRGLRTLVLDMLRYRHHPTHFTVDQAIDAASQIGADRTYFVHMTHDIRHAELDPTLPAGMALAHDGLAIGAE